MNPTAFKHGIFRFFACFCLCLLAVISAGNDRVAAQNGDEPKATVEKVIDLGVLETTPEILGRDGGYSTFFKGRFIWVFGDTIIQTHDVEKPAMLSNSCSWTRDRDASDGLTGFEPCPGSSLGMMEFFPFTPEERAYNHDHRLNRCVSEPCGTRWALWPGAVIHDSTKDRLIFFFKKVLVKPAVLDFHTAGHSLAIWHKPDEPLERLPGLMFSENEPAFGSGAIVVGPMVYVFGCDLEGYSKPCRLARAPLATITERDTWEFYDTSHQWQKTPDSCRVVMEGNDMLSVSYNPFLQRYLAVYSQPMGTGVMLRTAKEPTGPWSDPLKAFDALSPVNDIGWIYDAMEHPEYARKDGREVFITYSRQTGEFTFEVRLVTLTLGKK